MSDSAKLERRYRQLLACYPRAFRREHEREILAVLMDGADECQEPPRLGEAANLITHALWMRLGLSRGGIIIQDRTFPISVDRPSRSLIEEPRESPMQAVDAKALTRTPAQGLGGQLLRISHVWINVSDLDRSVEFYESVLPYKRAERLDGPVQDFSGLGIRQGRIRGWVLRGESDVNTRAINLVQWIRPESTGAPYAEANHLGFYRTNSWMGRSGLKQAYDNVVASGGRPYGPPSIVQLRADGLSAEVLGFRDPDGITLEYAGALEPDPDGADVPHHVQINCRNLRDSYLFYRDVLGLVQGVRLRPGAPQAITNGSLGDIMRNPDGSLYEGDEMDLDAILIGAPADMRQPIDLLEWLAPRGTCGEPYADPTNLGIQRLSFEVVDIEAAHAILTASSSAEIGARQVGPLETWDLGELGRRRVITFKDIDGVSLEVIERRYGLPLGSAWIAYEDDPTPADSR
jgi:catechol 2,3-dioxygenase-like lactoylglutathione lyase family enzyme